MAPDPAPRLVPVVGALVRRGDRVLVTQRPPGGSFGDHWEFPGGKVEPGEDDRSALAREIREELGVEVRVGALYDRSVHAYPDFLIDFRVYECALDDGAEPVAVQVKAIAWVRPGEVRPEVFPPADLPVLQKLRAEAAGAIRD